MHEADTFSVPCHSCGSAVAVRSVFEFHNIGGFRGYSFDVECQCGASVHRDGTEGDFIPEPMKRAAAVRHHAFAVLGAIDYERRNLPASLGKTLLQDARLVIPTMLNDGGWLVYQFPDGRTIAYRRDVEEYELSDGATRQQFDSAADIASYLSGHS